LAAHREGFINRPYGLVDALWGRGYDPLPLFLGLGGVAAAALALLLASHGSHRRSGRDAVLLVVVVALAFLAIPVGVVRMIEPPARGGTGGNESRQGSDGQGNSQSGRQDGSTSSFADQQQEGSNVPVAVVLLHDDYDPPSGYYYFRQTAFSQFNGQRLVQDMTGQADTDVPAGFPSGEERVVGETGLPHLLRRLDTTVALLQPHPRPFALVNPALLDSAANPDPVRFVRAYRVTSRVLTRSLPDAAGLRVGLPGWRPETRRHYTEGPRDPRYADLAAACVELLRPGLRSDPFAQAVAIQYWLSKNAIYSKSSDHESAADPLADFLFGNRTGHCVYLAHSACLLYRARGIPSRVGAGYAVDGRNRGNGGSLLLRERDAHAWPEIYLDGLGWLPMDIAPERSLDPPDEGPDQGLQQMLGDMARQGAGKPPVEQEPAGGENLQEALRAAARVAARALALLMVAALLGLWGAKGWRRLAPHWCRPARLPVVAYRAALDRLADAGVLRDFGQTREDLASRQAGFSPAFAAMTALHLRAGLGRHAPVASQDHYIKLGRQVSADIVRQRPPWRRMLGLASPVSWLWVR
ncbi:MAG TPA: transglutaminase-like domain-containing protein, partial [Thermoanaerobaculaceae bacterium]|nr:transglutaminase-like domain-containing protein [Thermoanaerobaculaceae bacterium]